MAAFLTNRFCMKQIFLVLVLSVAFSSFAQEITLKKGAITDPIKVNDSIAEVYSLYIPTSFDMGKQWPVLFVFDMKGQGKQALSILKEAAEEQGYILATSNSISDSLSLSQNVLISNRMLNSVYGMLPIRKGRSYVAGFGSGAHFASILPAFIKNIEGVVSFGTPFAYTEVLKSDRPVHYIGVVGNESYNYPTMLGMEEIMGKMKFPNQLLVFEGGNVWPTNDYISRTMEVFTLAAMAKGNIPQDSDFIERSYRNDLARISVLVTSNKPLLADREISEMIGVYANHKNIDSLKESRKTLKRSSLYRLHARNEKEALSKEIYIKDDYNYYLEEDIRTYNFKNLGWWKYQMEKLEKYGKGANIFEKQMAVRLLGYINALIEDNMDILNEEPVIDLEALNFLYMLKTITAPKESEGYLKVISNSALMEDFGTALFYLDELLKNGFTDRSALYKMENTALLRITPEFNEIVEKYLKNAR